MQTVTNERFAPEFNVQNKHAQKVYLVLPAYYTMLRSLPRVLFMEPADRQTWADVAHWICKKFE
jgi:hypothetical protein